MRKANIHFLFLLTLAAGLGACSDQLDNEQALVSKPAAADYAQDKLSIKLRPAIVADIDNRSREVGVPTGNAELDAYLGRIGARRMTRIFPYAGRDEDRQRREGLNLWYTVILDTHAATTPPRPGWKAARL